MTRDPTKTNKAVGCVLFVFVMAWVLTSVWFAILLQDRGFPLGFAAGIGAWFGVFLVSQGLALIFASQRMIWRRTRGYPFGNGDIVEITHGSERGRQGRVSSHDQAIWHFQVRLTDEDGTSRSYWISAGRLKKVADKTAVDNTA